MDRRGVFWFGGLISGLGVGFGWGFDGFREDGEGVLGEGGSFGISDFGVGLSCRVLDSIKWWRNLICFSIFFLVKMDFK